MTCTAADFSYIQQLWNLSDEDTKPIVVDPTTLFYRPLFSMQGYRSTVDFWISQFGLNPSKIFITLEEGLQNTWEKLGFQNVNRARYLKHWYVFSTTASAKNEKGRKPRTAPPFKHLDLGELQSTPTTPPSPKPAPTPSGPKTSPSTPKPSGPTPTPVPRTPPPSAPRPAPQPTPKPVSKVSLELILNGVQNFAVNPGAW
jgi:hypothetical protein